MGDWFDVAQAQYDRAVPAYLEDDERDPEDHEPDPDEERDRRLDDEEDWENE